jgi:hypothetical protein
LLAAAGCGPGEQGLSAENDEPGYREALQLEKDGRTDEALGSYLKVIAKRGDQAPESHLDSGLIYLNHIKDPIAAIYHFRKYLEFEPNSRQAAYVRGLIDEAERDFARTLPGDPLQNPAPASDELVRLMHENEELKAELAALRAGSGAQPLPAGGDASAPMYQLVPAAPASASAPTPEVVPLSEPEPEAAPAAPAQSTRTYTVQPHDTLFGIAKKIYGGASNARVQAILAANRGTLSGPGALRPGMVLKIP